VTILFESYHPSLKKVQAVLPKYYVGELSSNELPVFPELENFYPTLKKRVYSFFEETRQDPKNPPAMWFRYAFIFLSFLFSFYAQFFLFDSFIVGVFFAVIMGFFGAQIGLNPLHDASHTTITSNPLVWKIVGYSHDFLNGASFLVWIYQHALGHHPYTNVVGVDPDIDTQEDDVRRIKIQQKWLPRYIYQHLYVPVLYGLLAWKTRFQDLTISFLIGSNGKIRVNPLTTEQMVLLTAGKVFWFLYRVVLPLYLGISLWKVLTFLTIADFITSYWLALTFQANHVVSELSWPVPNAKSEIEMDWAKLQLATTQDYAHGSWFWTFFTGSLNYQCVHHLFPSVHQCYYPVIAPIILKTAKEFGVPYKVIDTFSEALSTHLNHLKVLGQADQKFD